MILAQGQLGRLSLFKALCISGVCAGVVGSPGRWTYSSAKKSVPYFGYPLSCGWDSREFLRLIWKFDTLWEHPLGKGEATCHSSWLYSFMHRRYVEGYYKSSSLTHDANGREHSTCCGRNLWIVTNLYHNILLVFGLIIFWHPEMSLISVDLIVVYCSVLYLILDSTWIWYSLLLELKIPTLVWH